ncbi:MAG: hypothetical protein LPJ89_10580 [Hymenobacteraceae bacterium]|nr:hypothetical protein [Hymenobacteraceae bacterium]MDX5397326.1 hypothetical protein [Hymenobacteraceae bacterium]MDX5444213.1 hypothetical protein [Hymenobacteraceae bacterium]MDX5513405.1 hypothetical protein [Hymenobacteraceae bacterium]
MAVITLTIGKAEDLFKDPVNTPLDEDYMPVSGIRLILNQMQVLSPQHAGQVVISVCEEQATPQLQEKIRAAIKKYATLKLEETQRHLKQLHKDGFAYLLKGTTFLVLCLLITFGIKQLEDLPEFINFFLSEWLIIVGWVSMWRPIDLFLFDQMPVRKDLNLFYQLQHVEVTVKQAMP